MTTGDVSRLRVAADAVEALGGAVEVEATRCTLLGASLTSALI